MKKVFPTAEEMAHRWANGDMETAGFRGGRASADYNKFYSYSTAIGVVDNNGTLIMTSHRYSNTTSKHQNCLSSAFRYGKKLIFNIPIDDYRYLLESDIKEMLEKEKQNRIRNINDMIDKQSRARSFNYKHSIDREYSELKEIYEYFNKTLDYELPDISEMVAKLKVKQKEEKQELKQIDMKYIESQFLSMWRNGDTKHKCINTLTENMTKAQTVYVNNKLQFFFNDLDYIRIVNDRIETNRNATVSKEEAKLLLRCLESKRDCVGMKVGHYTVLKNHNDVIQIGCHKFRISDNIEILRGA